MEILLIRVNRKKKKIDKRDYCLKLGTYEVLAVSSFSQSVSGIHYFFARLRKPRSLDKFAWTFDGKAVFGDCFSNVR